MKTGAASLAAALIWTTPAEACHRFSVWRFPYPQRCFVGHKAFVATPRSPEVLPPAKELSLPSLEEINWGRQGGLKLKLMGIAFQRELDN